MEAQEKGLLCISGLAAELPSFATMTMNAVRVLVVGGSYAGLGAVLNLLNLSVKRTLRFGGGFDVPSEVTEQIPLDIHIVDERDGYGRCLDHDM